jgi:YesN/AraC family two-component response regulator
MTKKKIIILDDNQDLLKFLKEHLKIKYEVQAYNSPIKALKNIDVNLIDLFIVDINMPEMDGIQFIKKVLKLSPSKKFIVITGFPSMMYNKELLSLGIQYLLEKPFSIERLESLIDESLKKKENSIAQINVDIMTLLQILKYSNKKTAISIKSKNENGIIIVKNGFLKKCKFGNLKGLEALEKIQKLDDYIFTEIPYINNNEEESIPIEYGILETMRKLDEKDNNTKQNKKDSYNLFEKLKDDLNDAIITAELISLTNSSSVFRYKTDKESYKIFTNLTSLIKKELSKHGKTKLGKYYLINGANNKIIILVPLDNYLLGMTVDIAKIQLGLFLNILLPKIIEEIIKNIKNTK